MKRILAGLCAVLLLNLSALPGWASSPWTSKPRYRDRAEGKFVFGLKHTLFSWMTPWAEAHDPKYETQWTGFSVGIGKAFVYTAAGMIQLVTFPITIDFPDIGLGMHIPANHPNEGAAGKAGTKPAVSATPATTEVAVKTTSSAEPPEETSAENESESAPEPEKEPVSAPENEPAASPAPDAEAAAKNKLIK